MFVSNLVVLFLCLNAGAQAPVMRGALELNARFAQTRTGVKRASEGLAGEIHKISAGLEKTADNLVDPMRTYVRTAVVHANFNRDDLASIGRWVNMALRFGDAGLDNVIELRKQTLALKAEGKDADAAKAAKRLAEAADDINTLSQYAYSDIWRLQNILGFNSGDPFLDMDLRNLKFRAGYLDDYSRSLAKIAQDLQKKLSP